ncbi:kinase-like domain-containing protein [Cercophora newfieldiana]|uniref:Kinase-like domain-containing protein n=1 Tax=Cercophora newfieldiana TaxID=92897 RepID=A0AA39Y9W2_9PEZI|nr:kinase-like domain-containing protein [Cercophora newfieldiana]
MSVPVPAQPIAPALVPGQAHGNATSHSGEDVLRVETKLRVLTFQEPVRDPSPLGSSDSGDDSSSSHSRHPVVEEDHSHEETFRDLVESFAGLFRHCRTPLRHLVKDCSLEVTLHEQLVREYQWVDEREPFIPTGQLQRLVCEREVIEELLRIHSKPGHHRTSFRHLHHIRPYRTIRGVARVICHGRSGSSQGPLCKIFAVLLLIGYPAAIVDFISEGLCDADLPLSRDTDTVSGRSCLYRRTTATTSGTKVKFSENWELHEVVLFAERQWRVLAPIFSSDEEDYGHFPNPAILPFTALKYIKAGGHAEIYSGKIHPQHHDFPAQMFAVKKIQADGVDHEQFQNEVRMLKRVSNDNHIVELFGTYQHREAHYLILPLAKYDLGEYWQNYVGDLGTDTAVLKWMAQQCEGLAGGLSQVHHHFTTSMSSLFRRKTAKPARRRTVPAKPPDHHLKKHQFHGVHGDIKPSNILWFPDPQGRGTLKITDFGTGEFNDTESTARPSNSVPFTPPYRPPERALDSDDEIDISWTYDVWMLGCLYLEFGTWYVGGYAMLDAFSQSRKRPGQIDRGGAPFFELRADGQAVVKPAVEQHFDTLRDAVQAPAVGFFKDFLNMIQTQMLVVRPHPTAGNPAQPGRSSCKNICNSLSEIIGEHGYRDYEESD